MAEYFNKPVVSLAIWDRSITRISRVTFESETLKNIAYLRSHSTKAEYIKLRQHSFWTTVFQYAASQYRETYDLFYERQVRERGQPPHIANSLANAQACNRIVSEENIDLRNRYMEYLRYWPEL